MAKPLTYQPEPVPQDTAQDDLKRLLETLHENGVLRLLNGLVGQKEGVLEVALGQLDSAGGRNALATLTVLAKAVTDTDPDAAQNVWNGVQRGLSDAQTVLGQQPPSLLKLLGKLNEPEVRQGLSAAISLLGGLGAQLHEVETRSRTENGPAGGQAVKPPDFKGAANKLKAWQTSASKVSGSLLPMNEQTGRNLARVALGGALVFAGVSHLTFARKPFKAQVPDWVPLEKDHTVLYSGVTEVALGSALVLAKEEHRQTVGNFAAAFFVAIFPGNIAQYRNRRSAFGLDTDNKRFVRLLFQPGLVYWAWASTRNRRGK